MRVFAGARADLDQGSEDFVRDRQIVRAYILRNCINIGLPSIENAEIPSKLEEGDVLSVDLDNGVATVGNEKIRINPFPEFMQGIMRGRVDTLPSRALQGLGALRG